MSLKDLFIKPDESTPLPKTGKSRPGVPRAKTPAEEIADLANGVVPQVSSHEDSPVPANKPAVEAFLPVATTSVADSQEALKKMIYDTLPALAGFVSVYESLADLPGPSRIKSALNTTAKVLKFTKDVVLRDLQEALKKLELHAQDFNAEQGRQERAALDGKAAMLDQINQQLARLRQEQEKLEDQKSQTTAEIQHAQETFSQQRANYEIANKAATGEIETLLSAITKSP